MIKLKKSQSIAVVGPKKIFRRPAVIDLKNKAALKPGVAPTIQKIKKKPEKEKIWPVLFSRFSVKDQSLFIKRLSFLIRSNVPILESLKIIHSQTGIGVKKKIIEHLIKDVSNGQSLSASMGKLEKIFSVFTINVIRVGELSGSLSQNLNYLAGELAKKQTLKRKVISALIYPIFITLATISVAALLTVYIFPKIMPIFLSLDVSLPITTRIMLFVSYFIQSHGLFLIAGLVVLAIILIIVYRRIPSLKKLAAGIFLRMPIFGGLVKSYNICDFCRTFSLLLKSGFTVTEAFSIISESTNNTIYRKEYLSIKEHITKGEQISSYLEKKPRLFPDMVPQMVMIGETSGNLSETLYYLSQHYEEDLDDKIKNLSNSIEPVLMIFMGLIVGFVAVSIITPIYEITQTLSR